MDNTTETLGLNIKDTPLFVSGTGSSKEDQIAATTISLMAELKMSGALSITVNDLSCLLKQEPTLRDRLQKSLTDYKLAEA